MVFGKLFVFFYIYIFARWDYRVLAWVCFSSTQQLALPNKNLSGNLNHDCTCAARSESTISLQLITDQLGIQSLQWLTLIAWEHSFPFSCNFRVLLSSLETDSGASCLSASVLGSAKWTWKTNPIPFIPWGGLPPGIIPSAHCADGMPCAHCTWLSGGTGSIRKMICMLNSAHTDQSRYSHYLDNGIYIFISFWIMATVNKNNVDVV